MNKKYVTLETKVCILYEEWCGECRHINACHPVHDSAETIEFALYCLATLQPVSDTSAKKKIKPPPP